MSSARLFVIPMFIACLVWAQGCAEEDCARPNPNYDSTDPESIACLDDLPSGAASICEVSEYRCSGQYVERCKDDGSGWEHVNSCSDAEQCVDAVCVPKEQINEGEESATGGGTQEESGETADQQGGEASEGENGETTRVEGGAALGEGGQAPEEESSEVTDKESGETTGEEGGAALGEGGQAPEEESSEATDKESGETAEEEGIEATVEESGETAEEENGETAEEGEGEAPIPVVGCMNKDAENFDSEATVDSGICTFIVTFQLETSCIDLNTAEGVFFNSADTDWCGNCDPMTFDSETGLWTYQASIVEGEFQYKYRIGPIWEILGDAEDAACTTVTGEQGEFINRLLFVAENTIVAPVAFGSCESCPLPSE